MSRILKAASTVAVTATAAMAIALTVPGLAQNNPGDVVFESTPVVQPIPSADNGLQTAEGQDDSVESATDQRSDATSLAAMVRDYAASGAVDAEHRCLAIGIYFESRSEPLEGQLAVAEVILNRAQSGRFADSVCGVLTQPRQFSFVRGGNLPTPRDSEQWRTAVGVARVAMTEQWESSVSNAMFFHASRINPGWNRQRLGRLGNHVFYR